MLKECVCRADEQACTRDINVCLHFENAPADDLRDARPATTSEALAILRSTAEWGAINQLFFTSRDRLVTELCSCCGCCCAPLRRMKEYGNYGEQRRTEYVSVTDAARCIGCGQCEESCFFEARWTEGGQLHFADERCFGCGRCIGDCPEDAIALASREGRGEPIPSAV